MTPQDGFLVIAPIAAGREGELRSTLALMNQRPGVVDPQNSLLPFAAFDRLHFARFVILENLTADDITAYGLPPERFPRTLAFFGDCDGPAHEFLAELAQRAEPGLRRVFTCCEGFSSGANLLQWMRKHGQKSAAAYVNWVGRTVRQVREEAALRDTLAAYLDRNDATLSRESLRQQRRMLIDFVGAERDAGRLTLTPPAPTPLGWQLQNLLNGIGVPLALVILSPLLLIYLPIFLYQLRSREVADPEILPRPDPGRVATLAAIEDHDVTNPYIVIGSLKPGFYRFGLATVLLWLVDYAARHIYTRGYLTRVQTIHFARWVFVNGNRSVFFASNYDGALESYMDDFINKVGWGLNILFSNGVGYPKTNWLIQGGAANEQKFKYYIRRHQLVNEIWYKAYLGLTAFDLGRNSLIRKGLEQATMTDIEIRDWLSLF